MTKSLSVIVVDDEPLARQLLSTLVRELPDVTLLAECRNGREAIARTRELAPDLLILDIQMPGLSGFDVVKELQSDVMPNVVFCTAYQRYAIDAFDLHAVDYLLKPVDELRLQRAIERARLRLAGDPAQEDNKTPLVGAIDDIARRVGGRADTQAGGVPREDLVPRDRIAIKNQDSTVLVDAADIDWVDAAGDYMCLHVRGETLIMRSTLKNLMARLDPDKFKRIHRSTLVNLDRIVKVTPLQKGEYRLDLDCEQTLKVSRNYRQAIKLFLTEN